MNPINAQMQLGKLQAEQVRQAQALTKGQAPGASAGADAGAAGAARGQGRDPAEIKKVAEEFESLFLGIVLKSMRDAVQKSGLIDGGNAEDIYRSMLDEEYSKMMAAQRHTGLADSIEAHMLGVQGKSQAGPAAPAAAGSPLPLGTTPKLASSAGLAAYQPQALQEALRAAAKRATMEVGAGPASSSPATASGAGSQGGVRLPLPAANPAAGPSPVSSTGFKPKAI